MMQQQIQQQIQQQMPEQNQTGCQQSGQQQMVLCPVRVVYETQMLMQPGEQIQPNQAIFINPQNPPPWAQNRPVQNQVIYVQQMPNNYMTHVQAPIDPNQLYYQQAYHQIGQQQMIHPGHDMRQYQVNMMSANMVQNVPNIAPNIPTQVIQQNERISEPNFVQMQPNTVPNTQIQNVNPIQVVKQPNVNVQSMPNQQVVNQRQIYLNPGQQIHQQLNMTRPQLITVNPMQQANVQLDKNQANNVTTSAQVMPQAFANTMSNAQLINSIAQTEARMRKITPNVSQIPTNVRNVAPNYVYRPIQPRPQYRTNMPNVNMQNNAPRTPNLMNLQPMPSNINQEVRKLNEDLRSRKRKSESPDELNKKVTIVNINTPLPPNPIRIAQTPILNPVKSVEIGVNTSPVHRPKVANIQNNTKINICKNDDEKPKEEAIKPNDNNLSEKDKEMKTNLDTNAAEKVRYTVFPQARVRPPKDEFNKVNVNILKDTKNILYTDEKNEFNLESKSLLKEKILSRTEIKKESESTEEVTLNKNEDVTDTKLGLVKDPKDYVLTHVLDGIVIQESNTAFPIREPTKASNASVDKKREVIKVDGMLKGNCLELPISDLKLKEDKTKAEKDNPFVDLKPATVKLWTVDELCSHLAKYKWEETISLLQEHEIDGESLFLVTKSQLLHIGVKEKYADAICEFVKS